MHSEFVLGIAGFLVGILDFWLACGWLFKNAMACDGLAMGLQSYSTHVWECSCFHEKQQNDNIPPALRLNCNGQPSPSCTVQSPSNSICNVSTSASHGTGEAATGEAATAITGACQKWCPERSRAILRLLAGLYLLFWIKMVGVAPSPHQQMLRNQYVTEL